MRIITILIGLQSQIKFGWRGSGQLVSNQLQAEEPLPLASNLRRQRSLYQPTEPKPCCCQMRIIDINSSYAYNLFLSRLLRLIFNKSLRFKS
jgi:hypothetical protein